jgi:ketosteroid isomerase-like protein
MKNIITTILGVLISTHLHSQQFIGKQKDIDQILNQSKAFSVAYMAGDYDAMVAIYTTDGKIMPNGTLIIEGHQNIRARWVLPEGDQVAQHKSTPVEIRITGNTAYDFGYYEGETVKSSGERQTWKGKYVIIWRKENNTWRMYVDIWNRVL